LPTVHGVVLSIHAAAAAARTSGHAQDVANTAAARPVSPAGAAVSSAAARTNASSRPRASSATAHTPRAPRADRVARIAVVGGICSRVQRRDVAATGQARKPQ
jgi:hypothetical protein